MTTKLDLSNESFDQIPVMNVNYRYNFISFLLLNNLCFDNYRHWRDLKLATRELSSMLRGVYYLSPHNDEWIGFWKTCTSVTGPEFARVTSEKKFVYELSFIRRLRLNDFIL